MIRRTKTVLVLRAVLWLAVALTSAGCIVVFGQGVVSSGRAMTSDASLTAELASASARVAHARHSLDSMRIAGSVNSAPWSLETLRTTASQFTLQLARIDPPRQQSSKGTGQFVRITLQGNLVDAISWLHSIEQSYTTEDIVGLSLTGANENGRQVIIAVDTRFANP